MELFQPGEAYGYDYRHFIWVCTNPVARGFEKCQTPLDQAVLQAFRQAIQAYGLGRELFVFASAETDFSAGCMLGCKEEGTTIAVFSRDESSMGVGGNGRMLFFRNVRPESVESFVQEYFLKNRTRS